jgi:hypothetical protein
MAASCDESSSEKTRATLELFRVGATGLLVRCQTKAGNARTRHSDNPPVHVTEQPAFLLDDPYRFRGRGEGMSVPWFLWPVVAVLTWPASRFRDVGRTYEVALPPSDARAVVRGAVGIDPMHRPVMEGIAASRRSEVVGSVDDDGRLEIYVGGKRGSGLGLVGHVEACGQGSRIVTRVGWTSLHRWGHPVFTALVFVAVAGLVHMVAGEPEVIIVGAGYLLAAMVAGGWIANLTSSGRQARQHELPAIFERLERVLAPHLRQPPMRGGGVR